MDTVVMAFSCRYFKAAEYYYWENEILINIIKLRKVRMKVPEIRRDSD